MAPATGRPTPTWGRQPLRGALAVSRPGNAALAGVLPVVGAYVAGALAGHLPAALLAGVATALGVASGNAVNDVFDRAVDAVNAPDRPLPSGALSPRGAVVVAAATAAAAVAVTAAFLPTAALALGVGNLVVLVAYTPLLKGRYGLGNAAVAFLGASAFLFGGLAVGSLAGVWVLAALAGSATLARELLKDVEDVRGDAAEGLSTLPVALGPGPTTALGDACLVATVALSPVPFLAGSLGPAYLGVVAVADGLALLAVVRSRDDVGRSQRLVKYAMAVSALAFVLGRAV